MKLHISLLFMVALFTAGIVDAAKAREKKTDYKFNITKAEALLKKPSLSEEDEKTVYSILYENPSTKGLDKIRQERVDKAKAKLSQKQKSRRAPSTAIVKAPSSAVVPATVPASEGQIVKLPTSYKSSVAPAPAIAPAPSEEEESGEHMDVKHSKEQTSPKEPKAPEEESSEFGDWE